MVLIVLLISAVALPAVYNAFSHRQVSEAGRILQAGLVSARDAAIRADAPRGIRLLRDPSFSAAPTVAAFNRWVAIEPAPDYSIGHVSINKSMPAAAKDARFFPGTPFMPWFYWYHLDPQPSGSRTPFPNNVKIVEEEPFVQGTFGAPNEPVNWWWNVRVGDKIQIGGEGAYYTVVGPCEIQPNNTLTPGITNGNPELFVNVGLPGTAFSVADAAMNSGTGDSPLGHTYPGPAVVTNQFLFVVNGQDDDGDGYVDNGWNGVDENLVGTSLQAGPPPYPDDLREWFNATLTAPSEQEQWLGSLNPRHAARSTFIDLPYTITRRPVPSAGGRVTTLPANVVIDATTMGLSNERSRLPAEPLNAFVDILLNPNGTVVPTTMYSNPPGNGFDRVFYHFWLTERGDVVEPQKPAGTFLNQLPFPPGVGTGVSTTLKGDRALVTLYAKSGQISYNSLENFDPTNLDLPFLAAQNGTEEAK